MERKFSRSRKFILSRRRKGDQVTHNIISRVLSPVPRNFAYYLYHVSQVGQKPWSNLRSYAYSMPGLARRQSNMCTKRRIDRDLLDPVQQTGSLLLEKKSSIGQVPRQFSIHSFEISGRIVRQFMQELSVLLYTYSKVIGKSMQQLKKCVEVQILPLWKKEISMSTCVFSPRQRYGSEDECASFKDQWSS